MKSQIQGGIYSVKLDFFFNILSLFQEVCLFLSECFLFLQGYMAGGSGYVVSKAPLGLFAEGFLLTLIKLSTQRSLLSQICKYSQKQCFCHEFTNTHKNYVFVANEEIIHVQ